jgi:hypothetical protein
MKGIEAMFMPKWMDEDMEDAAKGKFSDVIPKGLQAQASALMKKVGK